MDKNSASAPPAPSCCHAWWDGLTQVQRSWLHSHFWDLELLAGWASRVMVGDLLDCHDDRTGRYFPRPDRGTPNGSAGQAGPK